MMTSSRALCLGYALIGLLALVGTWGNNVAYLHLGILAANQTFWRETLANPASRSITVDLLYLSLAVFVWMLLEARRLRMRGVWLYLVFGMLVAISVTVPIFLIQRERALQSQNSSGGGGTLRRGDIVGLFVVAVGATAYAYITLAGVHP